MTIYGMILLNFRARMEFSA